jgi:hypothetical protein
MEMEDNNYTAAAATEEFFIFSHSSYVTITSHRERDRTENQRKRNGTSIEYIFFPCMTHVH